MDTKQISVQYMKLSLLILTINFFFLLFQQKTRYLGISQRCRLGTDGKKKFHTAIITRKIKYNVKICNKGALLLLKEINASIIKKLPRPWSPLKIFHFDFYSLSGRTWLWDPTKWPNCFYFNVAWRLMLAVLK